MSFCSGPSVWVPFCHCPPVTTKSVEAFPDPSPTCSACSPFSRVLYHSLCTLWFTSVAACWSASAVRSSPPLSPFSARSTLPFLGGTLSVLKGRMLCGAKQEGTLRGGAVALPLPEQQPSSPGLSECFCCTHWDCGSERRKNDDRQVKLNKLFVTFVFVMVPIAEQAHWGPQA